MYGASVPKEAKELRQAVEATAETALQKIAAMLPPHLL